MRFKQRVFVTTDDQVNARTTGNLLVFAHREVRQRYYDFDALPVKLGYDLFCRVAGTAKFDVVSRFRSDLCVRQHQAKNSDLYAAKLAHHVSLRIAEGFIRLLVDNVRRDPAKLRLTDSLFRSEEHTSELQSLAYLVCRLLLEKKNHQLNIHPRRES